MVFLFHFWMLIRIATWQWLQLEPPTHDSMPKYAKWSLGSTHNKISWNHEISSLGGIKWFLLLFLYKVVCLTECRVLMELMNEMVCFISKIFLTLIELGLDTRKCIFGRLSLKPCYNERCYKKQRPVCSIFVLKNGQERLEFETAMWIHSSPVFCK